MRIYPPETRAASGLRRKTMMQASICRRGKSLAAAALYLLLNAGLLADTIYLRNNTIITTRRAWEEGDEIKYESAAGIRSLPKAAVRNIKQHAPVYVERAPLRLEGLSPEESKRPNPSLPIPLPMTSTDQTLSAEAIQHLRRQVANDPANEPARKALVTALNAEAAELNKRGEYSEARATLERALVYEPKDLTSLANLAGVQFEIGDFRGAEATLQKAEAIKDQDLYIHYLLGEVYYAQEKLERAMRQWRRGLQIGGDAKIHQHMQQRLNRAQREAPAQRAQASLTSQHFILHYDQQVADYRLGQKILTHLEILYARLAFRLFRAPPQTISVILLTQEAFFNITRAPNWSGALFDGKIKIPAAGLTEVDERLSAVLVHEMAHAFVALVTRKNCPLWLNEGIAQWVEGRAISHAEQRYLAGRSRQKALAPLRRLEVSWAGFSANEAALAYLEGLSAVDYLIRRGQSEDVLRKILEHLSSGGSIDEALQRAIGLTAEGFEKAWTDFLTAEY